MSKVPLSFSTTSSSPSKQQTIPAIPLICLILLNRYAEIVNVKLGDGSMRKGQVLEIAGKRAVVQVSLLSVKVIKSYKLVLVFAINHFAFILNHLSNPICDCRFSREHQALTTCTLIASSLVMCWECPSVLRCWEDHSTVQVLPSITVPPYLPRSSSTSR